MKRLTLIAGLLLASCAPAHADTATLMPQPLCNDPVWVVDFLASNYDEHLALSEVSAVDGLTYHFFANPSLGTFTLIRASADGEQFCAVAYGQADRFIEENI